MLIKTGSAEKIADVIVQKLGQKRTIAASEAFGVDLTALMLKNVIPALFAVVTTIILATILTKKTGKTMISDADLEKRENSHLPSFIAAIAGPVVVVCLLALRPLFGISVDPLIALPLGGIVCSLATRNIKNTISYAEFGLSKVIGVSILLIGTGTLAGIIKASALQVDVINILEMLNMPAFVLAPLSGILMAGATVIDSLPHGSFFHATGGSVNMTIKERLAVIPYAACVGLASTIVSVLIYLI